MTTYIDYGPSPLHQGSRSRTGDQVDRQFVHDLLAVLGDCRLLWLPNLTDTNTSTERSRHAADVTWSESLAAFDTRPARLGSGAAVAFNGTDEQGDVPDAGRYSFGDGATDQPFSIIAVAKINDTAAKRTLLSKYDTTTSATKREWRFYVESTDVLTFALYDESTGGSIGMDTDAAIAFGDWALYGATCDGGGSMEGCKVYIDAARPAQMGISSGTYAAAEDTASLVRVGSTQGAAAGTDFMNGSMALVALTAKELTQDEMWTVKELVSSYFGLSL